MRQNKIVVGITGGSGVGKSYISDLLRESGYPVIDADKTAHDSINEEKCIKELVSFFGEEILENGKINRKKLGAVVFSDAQKLKKLNEISHKYILADIERKIEKEASKIVFVDGATLIESKMPLDKIFAVLADFELRKERIIKRDNLTEKEAKTRILAQQTDEFYHKFCDFTIYNNGGEIDACDIIKRIVE